MTFPVFRIIQD